VKAGQRICALMITLALLGSLWAVGLRYGLEATSRQVEIVLDYDAFNRLVHRCGWDRNQVLEKLHSLGLTSLGVPEETLASLADDGLVVIEDGGRTGIPGTTLIWVRDDRLAAELEDALGLFLAGVEIQAGPSPRPLRFASRGSREPVGKLFRIKIPLEQLHELGLGFFPSRLEPLAGLELDLVLRPQSHPELAGAQLDDFVSSWGRIRGVRTLVFGGQDNSVPGYPDELERVRLNLQQTPLLLGDIEAPTTRAAQRGFKSLARGLQNRVVRVLSIIPTWQEKLDPARCVDMYLLGADERNIRMAYVRPFERTFNGRDLLDTNLDYVATLAIELRRHGLIPGPASTLNAWSTPLVLVLVLALGVAAAWWRLAEDFHPIRLRTGLIWTLLVLIGTLVLFFLGRELLARKLLALGGALGFASLAAVSGLGLLGRRLPSPGYWAAAGRAHSGLLQAVSIALAGGLLVAGIMSDSIFMLALDSFRGVKLLMVVPLLAVLAHYLFISGPQSRPPGQVLADPVKWGAMLLLGLVAVAGAVYMMRSGNTPAIGVSDSESILRGFLTDILTVRPRFKEILLGFPLLMLAFSRGGSGRFTGMLLLLLAGAIGLADVVDTFCHVHSPLGISLLRTVLGLVIGSLFGLVLVGLERWVVSRWKTTCQTPRG